jgi:hypothetical protein
VPGSVESEEFKVSAVNKCPKCQKLAEAEPGEITRMYDGVCIACWRSAHPGEPLPSMPSQEFFGPTRLAESKLFKKQLDDIWSSNETLVADESQDAVKRALREVKP